MDYRSLLKLVTGGETRQHGTPFGAAVAASEISQMIAAGMGRHMTVGAFSTGVLEGTVMDLDRPLFAVGVPSGYCIRPIRISAQIQTGLINADSDENEILFAVDSLGLWTGDGTFTSEQPSNMRTDLTKGSACRCGSDFSADMTTTPQHGAGAAADPVLDMELAFAQSTADLVGTAAGVTYKVDELLYEPLNPPYLVGPCTLLGYWGATVAVLGGFAQVAWVEGRTEEFFRK